MRPIFAHTVGESTSTLCGISSRPTACTVSLHIPQKNLQREDSELFFVCTPISYGALQRSIIGPIIITPYTTPPSSIIA